jgi:hypothetical protein
VTASPAIGFSGSVGFAALAGLAFTPVLTACDVRDPTTLAALYLTAVAAAYGVLVGYGEPEPLGRVGIVLIAGAASCLASSLAPTALVLTAALGFGRARSVSRARFERPVQVELGLACGALVAVALTVSRSYAGISLAIWSYFLVQSAYFLLPVRSETEGQATADMGGSR